jgi:dipeptidyl aminopeptidase/acylaminoacyl peptidase
MKQLMMAMLACFFISSAMAQSGKKVLQHSDYDGWKNLRNQKISANGEWISYEINPQKGDGFLYLYQVATGKLDSVSRGYSAVFSPNSKVLTFKVKAQFDTIRQMKMDKKDLPKDSLFVWQLDNGKFEKYADLKSFQMPEEKGNWMAFLKEMPKEEKDSLATDSLEMPEKKEKSKKKGKKNGKKDKVEKGELLIKNMLTGKEYRYENVSDYQLSRNGNAVNFIQIEGDSVTTATVNWFSGKSEQLMKVFEKEGSAKKASISPNGDQIAFIFSQDTVKNKTFDLYYANSETANKIVDLATKAIQNGWTVSKNRDIYFSRNGEKLFFGVAPQPVNEPKDTLLDEEKYHVDVWNWKDPLLQPQQKVQAKKEKKRTWLSVYYPKENKVVQLGTEDVRGISTYDHGNARFALGSSPLPYQQLTSWDDWYSDFYLVDTETGKKELILKKKNSKVEISPAQKYMVWYESQDSIWYSYNMETKARKALTKSIKANFYDEIHDTPNDPSPYGIIGWTKGDKNLVIKDRYDFWKLDPSGKKQAENITNGFGRRNKVRLDYVQLDEDELFIDLKKPLLLEAFGEKNKKSGYFTLNSGNDPKQVVFEDANLEKATKAKSADRLIWNRSTFEDYPNLWTSGMNFSGSKQVSDANPQQKNYNWGTVDLVEWTSGDGEKLQGMLYKPENFDPKKKYPMLVYFYERTSDRLHRHHVPQPNWSIINPSYCVSNGYVIFMPDIPYKRGYPGESAYSSIVTGTLAMLDRYDFLDKENVALQGQSWGGYQIAYLVTRTNLYKCAMAGAPVSNMTSAYGGIRWKSGMSRMFQYERTQSRIGGTLWNSTLQYVENSPVFFAPKIETPLLIMHNDNDGAVPWYQGIELFVAMRRLQKPCWMLTYNNEAHNLRKRPNRMDLSVRMMQFFDHYLKGAPAPVWMEDGIPAVKKGEMDGYELKK